MHHVYEHRVKTSRGHPKENPLKEDEIKYKFKLNAKTRARIEVAFLQNSGNATRPPGGTQLTSSWFSTHLLITPRSVFAIFSARVKSSSFFFKASFERYSVNVESQIVVQLLTSLAMSMIALSATIHPILRSGRTVEFSHLSC